MFTTKRDMSSNTQKRVPLSLPRAPNPYFHRISEEDFQNCGNCPEGRINTFLNSVEELPFRNCDNR